MTRKSATNGRFQSTQVHTIDTGGAPTGELARLIRAWIMDGQVRQLSPGTLANRRDVAGKLRWFLDRHGFAICDTAALRAFFVYLNSAHQQPGGRWGKDRRPLRPVTVRTYHAYLSSLFAFVEEETGGASPMRRVARPIARPDQIRPLSEQQAAALIQAARRSHHPRRDEALIRLLLDTACRASEVCGLRAGDVDPVERRATVRGKGDKVRPVYYGRRTARALVAYLNQEGRDPGSPLFLSDRGQRAGDPLTRSGLLQLVRRLGKAAGIAGVRCSPHTLRHTAAILRLRAGQDAFSLMLALGHNDLTTTRRYLNLARADVEAQGRRFAPGDTLGDR